MRNQDCFVAQMTCIGYIARMDSGFTEPLSESERQIFETIWKLGPISRGDIALRTGLTAMTVSRLSRALEERTLIKDVVSRTGQRGNPIRPLSINPLGGCSVGLNFTRSAVEIGVIDLSGVTLEYTHDPIEHATSGLLIERVAVVLDRLRRSGDNGLERVFGVGVALPGDFEEKGRILAAHPLFADLRHRDLAEEFEKRLGLPVFLNSDSNCATVGERLLGAGRNFETYFYVYLGYGVGGGLVIRGEPYFGTHDNAGIIGVHFSEGKPRPSGLDLLSTLKGAGRAVEDFSTLEVLDLAVDPVCRDWVKRAGGQLRSGLRYVARLIDPEAIIIGGRLPNEVHHALAVEIDRPDFCSETELEAKMPRPRVFGSLLGARAGVIGAAALPIYAALFSADVRA
jgi:predicted NBD/HSP70 family sugar kinase